VALLDIFGTQMKMALLNKQVDIQIFPKFDVSRGIIRLNLVWKWLEVSNKINQSR
jgi:hypothetical protein